MAVTKIKKAKKVVWKQDPKDMKKTKPMHREELLILFGQLAVIESVLINLSINIETIDRDLLSIIARLDYGLLEALKLTSAKIQASQS